MGLEDAKTQVDEAFTNPDLKGLSFENTFGGATSFLRRLYTKDLKGVDIAVTGVPFDQAVTCQSFKRTPDGHAGHAELLGQTLFSRQGLPRRQLPLGDLIAQRQVDALRLGSVRKIGRFDLVHPMIPLSQHWQS